MQKPTQIDLTEIQSFADRAVAGRRGWSGPVGMTMTTTPPEPIPAPPAPTPPAPTPPAPANDPEEKVDEQGRGLGFPAETPVERMTSEQAAAYWRDQSRTQEAARRAWQTQFDGKTPEEVKAALDAAATAQMSEQEKAIKLAREEGIAQGQQAGVVTSAESAAMLLLETHLEHRLPDEADKDRRKILADSVNIKTAIGEDGKVDPVRVRAIAEALAPNGVKPGERTSRTTVDVGGGRRTAQTGTGVAAGRSLFQERRGGAKHDDA